MRNPRRIIGEGKGRKGTALKDASAAEGQEAEGRVSVQPVPGLAEREICNKHDTGSLS